MPQVIIEQPGVPPITMPLSGAELSFGRSEDNDVVLVADEVSRYHAKLYRRDNLIVLRDLKSLNGTYVNRTLLDGRTVLREGDEIQIGKYRATISLSEPGLI